jgi:hypothetical protein
MSNEPEWIDADEHPELDPSRQPTKEDIEQGAEPDDAIPRYAHSWDSWETYFEAFPPEPGDPEAE